MAYGNESSSLSKSVWSMWDTIQTNFNCCGYNDYIDWNLNGNVKPDKSYPCTCTKAEVQAQEYFCNLTISEIKSDGCKASVEAWLSANLLVILSVCLQLEFLRFLLLPLQFISA
uniref:tetraspanin-19-like n=1 Tax=Myxine glutinosa TaxID=7769 RepID=UPI00358DFF16